MASASNPAPLSASGSVSTGPAAPATHIDDLPNNTRVVGPSRHKAFTHTATHLMDINPDPSYELLLAANAARLESADFYADRAFSDTQGFHDSQFKACKRFMSDCRHQKAIFLMHAVGSGKTITSLCMVFNLDPSIQTTVLTIRGLESAFNDEIDNLNAIYTPAEVTQRINDMRVIFYDEFAARLLGLAEMTAEDRAAAAIDLFENKMLIIDEAHKLLKILNNDTTGRSEKMMLYVFSRCAKVVFLTATPIQRDWSDFARLLKIISLVNDPSKLTTLRAYDEVSFKKDFWFPKSKGVVPWWAGDSLYTLFFVKIDSWSKALVSARDSVYIKLVTTTIPGIIKGIAEKLAGVLGILTAAGGIDLAAMGGAKFAAPGFWKALSPTAKNALKIAGATTLALAVIIYFGPATIAGAGALVAGAASKALVAVPLLATAKGLYDLIMNWAVFFKDNLHYGKEIVDKLAGEIYPADMVEVTHLFSPFISFVDYKATELEHIALIRRLDAMKGATIAAERGLFARAPIEVRSEPRAVTAAAGPFNAPPRDVEDMRYPPVDWRPDFAFKKYEMWPKIVLSGVRDGTPFKRDLRRLRKIERLIRLAEYHGTPSVIDDLYEEYVRVVEKTRSGASTVLSHSDPIFTEEHAAERRAEEIRSEGWMGTVGRLIGLRGGGIDPRELKSHYSPADADLKKLIRYEKTLARFPILHVIKQAVPLNDVQKTMRYIQFSKGYVPSMGELYSVGRISGDFDRATRTFSYYDSTYVPLSNKMGFHSALRSLGNYSLDTLYYMPIHAQTFYDLRGAGHGINIPPEKLDRVSMFARNGQYVSVHMLENEMKQLHGAQYNAGIEMLAQHARVNGFIKEQFLKMAKVIRNTLVPPLAEFDDDDEASTHALENGITQINLYSAPTTTPIILDFPFKRMYSCPKFEKALELITEARKKFVFLPVVYSNFDAQGFRRFSAFLTSLDLPHYVLTPRLLQTDPNFVKTVTQQPFLRWLDSPDNIHNGSFLEKLKGHMMGTLKPTPEEVANVFAVAQRAIRDQPACILIDPSLQEGLSLTLNEVMICLEVMTGYGNQEQVYGRVVRSYSNSIKYFNKACYDLVENQTFGGGFTIDRFMVVDPAVEAAVADGDGSQRPRLDAMIADYSARVAKDAADYAKAVRTAKEFLDERFVSLGLNVGSAVYLDYSKRAATGVSAFKQTADYKTTFYTPDNLEYRPEKFAIQLYSVSAGGSVPEENFCNIHLRALVKSALELLTIETDEAVVKWLTDVVPENIATPIYEHTEIEAIGAAAPSPLIARIFYNCVLSKLPKIAYGINLNAFIPYVMFDAVKREYKILAASAKADEPNPQRLSEVAGKGLVETDGHYCSDELWLAKNFGQECEFNNMRLQLAEMEDDATAKLYPTDAGQAHFIGERFACDPAGSQSQKYYPVAKRGQRCTVKAKGTKALPSTCDRIGPVAIGGGRREAGKTRKQRGGVVSQTMTMTEPRTWTPKVWAPTAPKKSGLVPFSGRGQVLNPGVATPSAEEIRALGASRFSSDPLFKKAEPIINTWFERYSPMPLECCEEGPSVAQLQLELAAEFKGLTFEQMAKKISAGAVDERAVEAEISADMGSKGYEMTFIREMPFQNGS